MNSQIKVNIVIGKDAHRYGILLVVDMCEACYMLVDIICERLITHLDSVSYYQNCTRFAWKERLLTRGMPYPTVLNVTPEMCSGR